jgi:hypothetical protein
MERLRAADRERSAIQEAYRRHSHAAMREQSWRVTNALEAALDAEPGKNVVVLTDENRREGWDLYTGKSKKTLHLEKIRSWRGRGEVQL